MPQGGAVHSIIRDRGQSSDKSGHVRYAARGGSIHAVGGDANRPRGSALRVGARLRHMSYAADAGYCDAFGTEPPNELPKGEKAGTAA